MAHLGSIKYKALRLLPRSLQKRRVQKTAPAIVAAIRELSIRQSSMVQVGSQNLPAIILSDGTWLIGELPSIRELTTFSWLAKEMGLPDTHAKILIDAVTRWRFPHMAAGCLKLPWPIEQRAFFHPQHLNLAQEEATFSPQLKQVIRDEFLPQAGWRVVDIGAYLGHGALHMARAVQPGGSVMCIEAKENNYRIIQKTVDKNRLENVAVRHHAIYHSSGETISFNLGKGQANAIDPSVAGTEAVPTSTTSLPEILKGFDQSPDLVSLTVNGAELEAIDGLSSCESTCLPKRFIMPGWYKKDGTPRHELIRPELENLNYRTAVTSGGLIFAWQG